MCGRNEANVIWLKGDQRDQFVYVAGVSRWISRAAEKQRPGA